MADYVNISPFYFHKGFSILCRYSIMEYIRNRRMTLAKQDIPLYWQEHYAAGNGKYICGMFGINIDPQMGNEKFEYLIADVYNPSIDIPKGFTVRTIPAFTWAVFPCKGALPQTLQDVNTKIFSEWLPALQEYEFAAGYCIEMYDASDKYPKGTNDENYYSEI